MSDTTVGWAAAKEDPDQVTVNELIALLQGVSNRDAPVLSDGCDCFGPAVGIEEFEGQVIISRTSRGSKK